LCGLVEIDQLGRGCHGLVVLLLIDKVLGVMVTPRVLVDTHVSRDSVFIDKVNYSGAAGGLGDDRLVVSTCQLFTLMVHLTYWGGRYYCFVLPL
jgi:hypothetical protein